MSSEKIRSGTYGNPVIKTPYGERKIVYADNVASGQAYQPIEKYIDSVVYPYYANTHSNAFGGRYMTHLICKSKNMIRNAVGAKDTDRVLFTGNGCTGAVLHLIHALNIKNSSYGRKIGSGRNGKNGRSGSTWTVFITSTEHNSNYLPWKHLPVNLEIINITEMGKIDMDQLRNGLKMAHKKKHRILSCFSAGSNVTGVFQDVHNIARLVHSYGGLVVYDYAAIAPYVKINMHRNDSKGDYFDAIFVSPHKFLGGPGTCGLLVAGNKCFLNNEPCYPGGGTVRFVSTDKFVYSSDIEIKENGGTPNIIASIKTGLAFKLKQKHLKFIVQRNESLTRRIQKEIMGIKDVYILNPHKNLKRIPVFSFVVMGLHYNLVVVLLNDLFGIQSRGGISCCGIFAQYLLHMNKNMREKVYSSILGGRGVPKEYGWCRISFNYYMPNFIIDYIIDAVKFVAKYGYLFLKEYKYDCKRNIWVNKKWTLGNDFEFVEKEGGNGVSHDGRGCEKRVWITKKECGKMMASAIKKAKTLSIKK